MNNGRSEVMVVASRTRGLGAALMLSAGTLWPFPLQADQLKGGYTMTSPDLPTVGYVTGASVSVKVTGPAAGTLHEAKLTLNGQSVTTSFSPDGVATVS